MERDPYSSFPSEEEGRSLSGATIDILGHHMDNMGRSDFLERAGRYIESAQTHHVVAATTALLLSAQNDGAVRRALEMASCVLPSSGGIAWAAGVLGQPKPRLPSAADVAYDLCALAQDTNTPVYLVGGRDGLVKAASKFLNRRFPNLFIASQREQSYLSDAAAALRDINLSRSRIVFLNAPLIEAVRWVEENFDMLPPALYFTMENTFETWARADRAPILTEGRSLQRYVRLSDIRAMLGFPRLLLKIARQKFRFFS